MAPSIDEPPAANREETVKALLLSETKDCGLFLRRTGKTVTGGAFREEKPLAM
jgi:hypothetical protein